ncbi:MAG: hypothetical protein LH645_07560 [Actinomycetia bacterium]|nr:hypothetical protein [Actinomycetes bacterium]
MRSTIVTPCAVIRESDGVGQESLASLTPGNRKSLEYIARSLGRTSNGFGHLGQWSLPGDGERRFPGQVLGLLVCQQEPVTMGEVDESCCPVVDSVGLISDGDNPVRLDVSTAEDASGVSLAGLSVGS